MHGSVRDGLEDLLAAKPSAVGSQGLMGHLSSCEECSSEVQAMAEQSTLVRSLRAPDEVEPVAGFYARVLQRIEERAKDSIWAVFIYSPFGKRLTFASFTLALLLGSYVVAQESRDGHLLGGTMSAQELRYDALVAGSQDQQRDVVLANFASYHLVSQEGSLQ
jgi:predicted anti-sigma-YlaC factor YlaD